MDNGLHVFKIAASILITCALITAGVLSWRYFKTASEANNQNMTDIEQQFAQSGLNKYNGVTVTGAEVVNAVNKYKDDYQIKIKNISGRLYYYGQADTTGETINDPATLQDKTLESYVNPTQLYYASLYAGNNVIGVYFNAKTDSDGTAVDEESASAIKSDLRNNILKMFMNSFGSDAEADYVNANYSNILSRIRGTTSTTKWGQAGANNDKYNGETFREILIYVLQAYADEIKANMNATTTAPTPPSGGESGGSGGGGSGGTGGGGTGGETGGTTPAPTPSEDVEPYKRALEQLLAGYVVRSEGGGLVLNSYEGMSDTLYATTIQESGSLIMSKAGRSTDTVGLTQAISFNAIDKDAIPASISTVYLSPNTMVNDGAFQADSHVASIIFTTESGGNGLSSNSFQNVGNVTFYVRKGTSAWNNVQTMATAQGLGTIDYGKSYPGLMGAGNVTIRDLDIESEKDGWVYEFVSKADHSKGLRILGYNGTLSGDVTIPSSLAVDGDVTVTEIASNALKQQGSIASITVPTSVKKIGSSAFENCGSLAEVKIGAADLIDMSAFKGCNNLGKVTIDGSALSTNSGKVTQYLSIFDDCKDDLAFKVQTNTNAYSFLKEYVDKHNSLYGTHYTISKSTYVLKRGSDFNKLIPSNTTAVKFCYDTAPSGAAIIDVDADGDGGVVAWMEGTTMKVSTQEAGTKVKTDIDCNGMFSNKIALTGIDLTALDASAAISMRQMFCNCKNLTTLNLSTFAPVMVTDFSQMFGSCENLQSLDLSKFHTYSARNMEAMFINCIRLQSINLRGVDTSRVTNMKYMFCNCKKLASLDARYLNTVNATDMYGMFDSCRGLTSINVSSFRTHNVKDFRYMFNSCEALPILDISNFTISDDAKTAYMVEYCKKLRTVRLPDMSKFEEGIFFNCGSLQSVNVPDKISFIGVRAFQNCYSLAQVTVKNANALANNVNGGYNTYKTSFHTCKDNLNFTVTEGGSAYTFLKDYVIKHNAEYGTHYTINGREPKQKTYVLKSGSDFDNLIPENATAVVFCYEKAPSGAAIIDVDADGDGGVVAWMDGTTMKVSTQKSGVKVQANANCADMFRYCSDIASIDFAWLDTSNVTDMSNMFDGCWDLRELDLSSFDTTNVKTMKECFVSNGILSLTLGDKFRFTDEPRVLRVAEWTNSAGQKFNVKYNEKVSLQSNKADTYTREPSIDV